MKITNYTSFLTQYLQNFNFTHLLLYTVFLWSNCIFGQTLIFKEQSNTVACDTSILSFTVLNNTAQSLNNAKLKITLPCGMHYVPNSITIGANDQTITQLEKPIFALENIAPNQKTELSMKVFIPCSIIDCINSGMLFHNSAEIITADQNYTFTSNDFTVATPYLVITRITDPVMSIYNDQTIKRKIVIRNTRQGRLNQFTFRDVHDATEIITCDKGNNFGSTASELKLLLDKDAFRSIGNKDDYFDLNEEIILTETIALDGCPSKEDNLINEVYAEWGCDGSLCQSAVQRCRINAKSHYDKENILTITSTGIEPSCAAFGNSSTQTVKFFNKSNLTNITDLELTFTRPLAVGEIGVFDFEKEGFKIIPAFTPYTLSTSQEIIDTCGVRYGLMILTIKRLDAQKEVSINFNINSCYKECWGNDLTWSARYSYKKECAYIGDDVVEDTYTHHMPSNRIFEIAIKSISVHEGYQDINFTSSYVFDKLLTKSGSISLEYLLPCKSELNTLDFSISGKQPISKEISSNLDGTTLLLTYDLPFPKDTISNEISFKLTCDPSCNNTACSTKWITTCENKCEPSSEEKKIVGFARINSKNECDKNGMKKLCGSKNFSFDCSTECLDTIKAYLDYVNVIERINYNKLDLNNDYLPDASGIIDTQYYNHNNIAPYDTFYNQMAGVVVKDFDYFHVTHASIKISHNCSISSLVNTLFGATGVIQRLSNHLIIYDKSKNKRYNFYNLIPDSTSSLSTVEIGERFDLYPEILHNYNPGFPLDFEYENGDSIYFRSVEMVSRGFPLGETNPKSVTLGYQNKIFFDNHEISRPQPSFSCNCTFTTCTLSEMLFRDLSFFIDSIDTRYECAGDAIHIQDLQIEYGHIENFCLNEYRENIKIDEILFDPAGYFLPDNLNLKIKVNEKIVSEQNFKLNDIKSGKILLPNLVYEENCKFIFTMDLVVQRNFQCEALKNKNIKTVDFAFQFKHNSQKANGAYALKDSIVEYKLNYPITPIKLEMRVIDTLNTAFSKKAEWSLQLSTFTKNSSLYNLYLRPISSTGKVSEFRLFHVTSNTEIFPVNGIFTIGNFHATDLITVPLKLIALNESCVKEKVILEYGVSCSPWIDPTNPPCYLKRDSCLVISPAGLAELIDNSNNLNAQICEPFDFSYLNIINSELGSLYNTQLELTLPNAFVIIPGSCEYEYPEGSGQFKAMQDPTHIAGPTYFWKLNETIADLNTNLGLVGVNKFPSNSIVIRFKTKAGCGYLSGDRISYKLTAEKNCGTISNTVANLGEKYYMEGVVSPEPIDVFASVSDTDHCQNRVTLSASAVVNVPSSMKRNFILIMPSHYTYISSSTPPLTISADTITWLIPENSNGISIKVELQAENKIDCSDNVVRFLVAESTTAFCTDVNQDCELNLLAGEASVKFNFNKPVIDVTQFKFTGTTLDDSSYVYTIQNTSDLIVNGFHGFIFLDRDHDGLFSVNDSILLPIENNSTIIPGMSSIFHADININPFSHSCDLVLFINAEESCLCQSQYISLAQQLNIPSEKTIGLCSGKILTIGKDSIVGANYQWFGTNSNLIPCATCSSFQIEGDSVSITGVLSFILKEEINPQCHFTYEYQVSANEKPFLFAEDQEICKGEVIDIFVSPASKVQWSGENIIFSDDSHALVQPNSSTTYSVDITTFDDCIASDTIRIEVSNPPHTQPDTLHFCVGEMPQLNPGFVSGYQYQWITFQENLSNPNIYNPYLIKDLPGEYIVSLNDGICSVFDTIDINFDADAMIIGTQDKYVTCQGSNIYISLSGSENYVWKPMTNVECLNSTCSEVVITPYLGTIQYEIIGSLGSLCTTNKNIMVTGIDETSTTNHYVNICRGASIDIHGMTIKLPGTYCDTTLFNGPCLQIDCINVIVLPVDTSREDITICEGEIVNIHGQAESESGLYCTTLTNTNGCDSISCVELNVLTSDPQLIQDTIIIKDGESFAFTFDKIYPLVQILPGPLTECMDCNFINVSFEKAGSYVIELTDENGCMLRHNITVIITEECIEEVKLPNAFTPGDNGLNDVFRIVGVSQNSDIVKSFRIYNEWGQEIFTAQDNKGWDGRYKNLFVTPGVYLYVLELNCVNGERKLIKGDVTVIR